MIEIAAKLIALIAIIVLGIALFLMLASSSFPVRKFIENLSYNTSVSAEADIASYSEPT